jgi:hypothetical protein
MITLADGRSAVRFLSRLRGFLRHPVTVAGARAELRRRLEHREDDFLSLMRRTVFEHPPSPYRALLRHAGCEYGDLERMVRRDGVEGSLQTLLAHGVYLTVDEFKGRRPAVRGGRTIAVAPEHLRNPMVIPELRARTGGSRGVGLEVGMTLAFHRDRAVNKVLFLDARGGLGWRHGVWLVPGVMLYQSLRFYACGIERVESFSPIDPYGRNVPALHRWSDRGVRWVSRAAGRPFRPCVHAPPDEPLALLRWIETARRDGVTPHLYAYPSPVLRLVDAARAAGVALDGLQLTLSGEPLTPTRLAVLRRAGIEARPRYGTVEAGAIAYGCLRSSVSDEVHVIGDTHAMIQTDTSGPEAFPPGALLLSSLRATAPFVLLNVSLGDQATRAAAPCGCPLHALGWTLRLHSIRSFEKLTAAGMTFLDTDVIRVLEEVLPARFGGGPTDYQLVETEGPDGLPRLQLYVRPEVGHVDDAEVVETFLSAISAIAPAERVMGLAWRDAKMLSVERRSPFTTSSGKIHHVHLAAPRAASITPPR